MSYSEDKSRCIGMAIDAPVVPEMKTRLTQAFWNTLNTLPLTTVRGPLPGHNTKPSSCTWRTFLGCHMKWISTMARPVLWRSTRQTRCDLFAIGNGLDLCYLYVLVVWTVFNNCLCLVLHSVAIMCDVCLFVECNELNNVFVFSTALCYYMCDVCLFWLLMQQWRKLRVFILLAGANMLWIFVYHLSLWYPNLVCVLRLSYWVCSTYFILSSNFYYCAPWRNPWYIIFIHTSHFFTHQN
jgi:hypothetical protein